MYPKFGAQKVGSKSLSKRTAGAAHLILVLFWFGCNQCSYPLHPHPEFETQSALVLMVLMLSSFRLLHSEQIIAHSVKFVVLIGRYQSRRTVCLEPGGDRQLGQSIGDAYT